MQTTIISIGNSRGIRIPKVLLAESGIVKDVEIKVKAGELRIRPIKPITARQARLSESVLATDWNRPEEEEAWADL